MNPLRGLDLGRVVLSVVLAMGLWVVVQNEQNPERTGLTPFEIPVEVDKIPDGLVLLGEPQPVRAWVRAPESVWPRLGLDRFRARVNASGARAGVNELPVVLDTTDPGVRSAEPRPDRVLIRLEEIRERSVPVRVNTQGNVPFGYSFSEPRVTPDRVMVTGPESLVQRVDRAIVDIRLDGVTVSINGGFTPRAVDSRGTEVRGVRFSPSQVAVDLAVQQEVTYKEVGIRPVTVGKVAPGYYLLPLDVEPLSATIVGHPSLVSAVTVLETEPVNVSEVSSSVVRRVGLRLPTGVSLLQPQLTVLVTVRVQPLEITQSLRVLPTVEGLAPDLALASPLPLVELAVTGPAPTLQQLTPRDFKVTLNLANLGPGRHMVEPRAAIPGTFELERVEPPRVAVELRRIEPPAVGQRSAAPGAAS